MHARLARLAAVAVIAPALAACSIRKVTFIPLDGSGGTGGRDAAADARDADADADAADARDAADTNVTADGDTDGGGPDACEGGCGAAVCGNRILETGETCDDGPADTATCIGSEAGPTLACQASRCGDGHLNPVAGEQCDDGNQLAGDTCDLQCHCTTSLVPVMTSNTAPSGVVTTSGAYDPTYDAWQAFDASDTTMWISAQGQTPAWVAYQWSDGPRTVRSYAITYSNGSIVERAPASWTFEGWNGAAWVVLDSHSGEPAWLGSERRVYTVSSPGSYAQYLLNITEDYYAGTGITVVSMGKLELLGCPP